MENGMSAPDLGFEAAFGIGASESGAAAAPQTTDAGAAGQAAGSGVAPITDQGAGAATEVAGPAGQMPSPEAKTVPASDLDTLRSTYDRQLAQIRTENEQLNQALWEMRTASMTPEQKREAEAARAFQGQLSDLVRAAAASQQQMVALEPVFKKMAVDEMVQQYGYAGIKAAELEQFNDPDLMESYCKALATRYNASRAQRQQPANQAAAGSGGAAAPVNFAKMDRDALAKLAFG